MEVEVLETHERILSSGRFDLNATIKPQPLFRNPISRNTIFTAQNPYRNHYH